MKRPVSFVAAAAALGLAATAYAGQTSPGPQPTEQATPSPQQSPPPAVDEPSSVAPSADPSRAPPASTPGTTSPPAASQGPSTEVNTRLAAIVPSGMTSQEACQGFKSVMECAAALHAAQNLNLPFPTLKALMSRGETLPAAIHDLRPEADASSEVHRAVEQARADLSGTPQG